MGLKPANARSARSPPRATRFSTLERVDGVEAALDISLAHNTIPCFSTLERVDGVEALAASTSLLVLLIRFSTLERVDGVEAESGHSSAQYFKPEFQYPRAGRWG